MISLAEATGIWISIIYIYTYIDMFIYTSRVLLLNTHLQRPKGVCPYTHMFRSLYAYTCYIYIYVCVRFSSCGSSQF